MPIQTSHFSPIPLLRKHKTLTVIVENYKQIDKELCVMSFIQDNKRYTFTYNIPFDLHKVLRRRWGRYSFLGGKVYATLEADDNDKDGFPRITGAF